MDIFFQNFHQKLIDYLHYSWLEITKNPQWFIMRKLARFHIVRGLKSIFSNSTNSLSITSQNKSEIFSDVNVKNVVSNLEKRGVCQGINLPTHIVQEIWQFVHEKPCYGNKLYKVGFHYSQHAEAQKKYGGKLLTGKYYNTALECPAIQKIASDPILQEIAAKYLKTNPIHISNCLWWSFPSNANFFEQSKAAQVFHCDLDDYKFIKFFFYISDVGIESGPHIYIYGSHKKKKFIYQLLRGRATEQDLIKFYGQENIITICGPSGWGFVEDTFGYHKGSLPSSRPRLMLQVEYATHDYGTQHDVVEASLLECIC